MARFTATIDKKGIITFGTTGIKGSSCSLVLQKLKSGIGDVSQVTNTEEYSQQAETNIEQTVTE